MLEHDFDQFSAVLDGACGLLSRGSYAPNPINTALFFRALARYEIKDVRKGFDAHISCPDRGRFVPVPADIIGHINKAFANDGRPGADEAWAVAIQARDEMYTVVWTEEIAQAWGIASHVYVNDEVGARMAFKDAYNRLVSTAREERQKPVWRPSYGILDRDNASSVRLAIEDGRLSIDYMPKPREKVAGLIELERSASIPDPVRLRLQDLRAQFRARQDAGSEDVLAKARTADLKTAAARKVAERGGVL
jgi:hypothetical protein